jgi:hypothetical protein
VLVEQYLNLAIENKKVVLVVVALVLIMSVGIVYTTNTQSVVGGRTSSESHHMKLTVRMYSIREIVD